MITILENKVTMVNCPAQRNYKGHPEYRCSINHSARQRWNGHGLLHIIRLPPISTSSPWSTCHLLLFNEAIWCFYWYLIQAAMKVVYSEVFLNILLMYCLRNCLNVHNFKNCITWNWKKLPIPSFPEEHFVDFYVL